MALLQQRAAAGAAQDTEVHFSACALTSSDEDGDTYDTYYYGDTTVDTSKTAAGATAAGATAASGTSSSVGGGSGGASGSSRRRHRGTAAKEKCKDTVGMLVLSLYTTM
jgi:hypothetical protein